MVDLAVRHRFTVDEFHRMGETGILSDDDRVELIDGEIVEMTPIGSNHARCVRRLDRWLQRLVGDEALVSAQQPLVLANDGEPIPDVAVLRPREDDYGDSHPTGSDALLVIAVADSSVLYDRNAKSRLYSGAGVPEYWVVDLPRKLVIVARNPVGSEYIDVREYRRGESWRSPALNGAEIRTDDILGPQPGAS